MSNCSNALDWLFQLQQDGPGTQTLTFEVRISDLPGVVNGVRGVITGVGDQGSTSDIIFSDGLCQIDPLHSQSVLSFRLRINADVGGTTVVKTIGVVGHVRVITPQSKQFFGGFFTLESAPGVAAVAVVPDPGDTGTAGGNTGA